MSNENTKVPAIAIITKKDNADEFYSLAKEAGYRILGYITAKLKSNGLSDYKINEIKQLMNNYGASEVIIDVPLKPKQLYNISTKLGVEVRDWLEIVLKIFTLHSSSEEAKLQIKLASLKYELTRLKEKIRLKKIGEQPGLLTGLGAYEIEKYYSDYKRIIKNIESRLKEISSKRGLHRSLREKKGYITISIVGYFSSGKTTLFNALTHLNQKTGPEPFTTLSTKFSLIKIGSRKCYLVDTVGFINGLPRFVIDAFRSTLEEVAFSDVILLVIDVSETLDVIKRKLQTSLEMLNNLNCRGKIVIVGNKIDKVNDKSYLEYLTSYLKSFSENVVMISAKTGENIEELMAILTKIVSGDQRLVAVKIPYDCEWSKHIEFVKNALTNYNVKFTENYAIVIGSTDRSGILAIRRYIRNKNNQIKLLRKKGIVEVKL
ncbi:MAG: GTPase HflX [Candidatus Geothermarchaeota archaeon]